MAPRRTVRYGDGPDQFVEVWDPVGPACGSAVLIHGGYWRDRYGLDLMDPMAQHLRERGWRVWNIEYRRIGPSDRTGVWDQMSADVRAAVALVDDDRRPVIVIGHSAGGQLALWAAADAAQPEPGRGRVDAVVALAPVADLVEADRRDLSDGAARLLLGGGPEAVPTAYGDASQVARLPLGVPQLIVHGEADDSVPIDLSIDYARTAEAAGEASSDGLVLLTPPDVDHFHIIDPSHPVWRPIQDQLDQWASSLHDASVGGGDFERLSEAIGHFTAARGWDVYHNPKNLLLALVGEVGELSELFQWLSPDEAAAPSPALLDDIRDEAADVLIYLIQLARELDIDLLAAAERKMIKNGEKYPPPQASGPMSDPESG